MEWVILLLIAAWIWSAAYQAGKREGSRKGYGVGFEHGKRAGCLVMLALAGTLLALASAVLARW
ncbi:MAG TPA: hypothetical protein PK777_04455 [Thermoguttaceae bacterium]|nr:hypothetical protein [Thermoguttaceae bacterium]HPP52182.1 hypothetical protein [Thermoguttaceae bacterium]